MLHQQTFHRRGRPSFLVLKKEQFTIDQQLNDNIDLDVITDSQLEVVHSDKPIKSIELQLVRVETCGE